MGQGRRDPRPGVEPSVDRAGGEEGVDLVVGGPSVPSSVPLLALILVSSG